MIDPYLHLITRALTLGKLRIHSSNKTVSRQKIYKLLRMNNIKTLCVIEGPGNELWLLRKENKSVQTNPSKSIQQANEKENAPAREDLS